MLAVVEAKPDYKKPADGLQQAKDYAQILGLKFAYSTNGHGIVEVDRHFKGDGPPIRRHIRGIVLNRLLAVGGQGMIPCKVLTPLTHV